MCSLTSRAIAARHLNRTVRKRKERDFQLTCCTNRKMHQSYIPQCPYFVTEMSSGVCIAFTKWCITGCLFNALGDLWDRNYLQVVKYDFAIFKFMYFYTIVLNYHWHISATGWSGKFGYGWDLDVGGFFILTLLGDTVMMAITYFSAHCVSAC